MLSLTLVLYIMGDIMETLNDIWKQVLAICKTQVSDIMYSMWLQPLEFYKLENDTAVFIVNADFRKKIIMSKFKDIIQDAFLQVIGFEVELDIVVDAALDDTPQEEKHEEEKDEEENNAEISRKKTSASYTFDNFVTGKSNVFAYNLAKGVAEHPGELYNPLMIYGHSGLGKTHLLFAIYNELKKNDPNAVIIYTTGESFLVELVECMSKKNTTFFHNKYRNVDALLVDDIQFIQKGVSVQEEFFHTFNALEQAGKQIIMTSDVPPKEMAVLDERLRTRFEMGVLADIQPPDIDTKRAIIKNKCNSLNITLSENVIDMIATHIKSNVRQLEGTVKKIEAYKRVYNSMPTMDQIQEIVKDVACDSQPISVIVDNVFSVVSETFGVSRDEMTSNQRAAKISNARNVCMYILKNITSMTLKEVGSYFNKNHATVLHSITKCTENMESDADFKATVNNIIRQVNESK